jgi:DNA modification methylase
VLDPFSRQRTTLVAVERTGRICRGMEIDPLSVDVAVCRWRRMTGDRAIHENPADFAVLELEETEARHDR